MPSYMTLTVFALAASTVSPALSAPLRVTRERALTQPELVSEKRGLFGFGTAKVADDVAKDGIEDVAAKAGKKTWGQRLKSLAVNTAIGGVAAIAGTSIYEKMNPNSKALGEPGPSTTSSTTTDPGNATTGPSYATTGPSYATTGPGYGPTGSSSTSTSPYYTDTGPSSASTASYYTSTNTGYTSTGYPTGSGYGSGTTNPSTSGTSTKRAIAERAREEHALDHKLPKDIFTRSNSKLNSRTSPHRNLLSRADLEKAIGLFTRMLDELD